MIYLAIPYTGIEETSFKVATAITGQLMKRGDVVFSPITHSHEVAKITELPTDWDFWERVDREFIIKCDRLLVVGIEGWKESKGVQAEIDTALRYEMPIDYLWLDHPWSKAEGMAFWSPNMKRYPRITIYES